MIIAVLDTNIYISGTFWMGAPKKILRKAKKGEFTAVISKEILDELKDVLTRKDKDFKLSNNEANKVIKDITNYAKLITPIQKITICRDRKDNMVIECAIKGKAKYIVSGDPDLKVLKEYKDIKIVSVNRFLKILKEP